MTILIDVNLVDSDGATIGSAFADANVSVVQGNDGHIYEKIDDYTFRQIDPPKVHVRLTPRDER